MASGIRLFTENQHHNNGMRLSYTDSFPAEFLFRNSASHPFSHMHFVPERIVEFSLNPEGLRFYKVQWQASWVPEHQLLQYHNIVEVFWQTQHDLNMTVNTNRSSKSVSVSEANQGNQSSIIKSNDDVGKSQKSNSYLATLQSSDNVDLVDPTITTLAHIDADVNNLERGEKIPNRELFNGDNLSAERELPVMPTENELRKVISQAKTNTLLTVQCGDFSIFNIKNSTASEEDLQMHAREVLSAFKKKRVRGPKGAANLPTACFFCGKVLSTRKHLRKHQFSVHLKNIGEYPCHLCEKRFAYQSKLKAHLLVHSDNRSFRCDICGLTCKRLEHLQKHMKIHNKECNYRCDVCHKNFKVQAELKTHCLIEHKNQVNTCNVCKNTLQTGYSVYMHSLRHSGTREFSCDECGASFKSKHHLIAHQKIHMRPFSSADSIKCPACPEEFTVTSSSSSARLQFRKHMEHAHKELASTYRYEYLCNLCGKDFAYKGYLDEHMRNHAEETPEELDNRLKKKQKKVESMSDADLAVLHDKVEKIINDATGEMKLKCKLCQKREFRLISTMEKHLEDHRNGRFDKGGGKCVICNKVFSSEARLIRHKRVHEAGEKLQYLKSQKRKRKQQLPMKCSMRNKSAGKRKAALTAKSKLQIQGEENSSDGEEVQYSSNETRMRDSKNSDENKNISEQISQELSKDATLSLPKLVNIQLTPCAPLVE